MKTRIGLLLLVAALSVAALDSCRAEEKKTAPSAPVAVVPSIIGGSATANPVDLEFVTLTERLELRRQRGEPEKMLKVLAEMEAVKPDHPGVWYTYGEVYGADGPTFDMDKAINSFTRFLKIASAEKFKEQRLKAQSNLADLEDGKKLDRIRDAGGEDLNRKRRGEAEKVLARDFKYENKGNSITIIKYTGPGGVVVIPCTIDGLPVSGIGVWTFAHCSSLANVTIPDSVISIGDWAFCGCSSLANITIPDSVISIGDTAFYDCSSLANVIIGSGVVSIGQSAFMGCTRLSSVTLPNSVTSIGSHAFPESTTVKGGYQTSTYSQNTVHKLNPNTVSETGCFIATAAYGASWEEHVIKLQTFRDRFLLKSTIGAHFVKGYYKYSPSVADFIRPMPTARFITRQALTPVVWFAGACIGSAFDLVSLVIFCICIIAILYLRKGVRAVFARLIKRIWSMNEARLSSWK